MSAPDLRALLPAELARYVAGLGEPGYRAQQIYAWLHRHRVRDADAMTNLPRPLRATLASVLAGPSLVVDAVQHADDGTRKLRLRCGDGAAIESVLIPRPDGKVTLCVSSQVGCGLGCRFCATATMGLRRNLDAVEIVDQVYRAQDLASEGEPRPISNIVLMGMGEPLANIDHVLRAVELLCSDWGQDWSPRRITLSTVGLVPGIRELGRRNRALGLAVSLHATSDAVRERLIPVARRWPLDALFEALRAYPLPRRRRITVEYMLVDGLNDFDADARRLARLLRGIRAKVNLLAFNPHPGAPAELQRPTEERVDRFGELLRDAGLTATVRRSRGLEIAAACGQLAVDEAAG